MFWRVELDLVLLMDRAASSGVFWGDCELNMTLGSLSGNRWGCIPVLLVVWREVPALELVGRWWSRELVLRRRPLGALSPINIAWGQEFSGGLTSWTLLSHLRGSGLTLGQGTKTLQATRHGRKVIRKNKTKQNKKRTEINEQTKPQQKWLKQN